MAEGTKLVLEGKTYESLLDAAAHYKLHPSTLARRLRYGWTNEQAVGLEEKPTRIGSAKKVVYKGVTYPNLKHLAEAFGKNAEMDFSAPPPLSNPFYYNTPLPSVNRALGE